MSKREYSYDDPTTWPAGLVLDRGYLLIRIWPFGSKNPDGSRKKPFIEHFGPYDPAARPIPQQHRDNLDRAVFKLRDYRNKIENRSFKIEEEERSLTTDEGCDLYYRIYSSEKDTQAKRNDMRYRLNIYRNTEIEYPEGTRFRIGTLALENTAPQHILAYRTARLASGVSFSTVNREQAVICSLFNKFDEWNVLGNVLDCKVRLPNENPCEYVKRPSERARRRTRKMTPEEWDRLVPHLNLEMQDHCMMALYSSLRLKDISNLAGKEISLDLLKDLQAKTGQEYVVPLTAGSLRQIALRIAARPRLSSWTVQRRFRDACVAAGIKDLTFRDLRRTGLDWLRKKGTDLITLRDKAGHADAKTTGLYLGSDMTEQERTVEILQQAFKPVDFDNEDRKT